MKRLLAQSIPWAITIIALYLAFRGIDWRVLTAHLWEAHPSFVVAAIALTCLSYLVRALRWRVLFPEPCIDFPAAAKVLVLGFFMNNILPARAGEIVRAHAGSRVTGETRTLVLATIASERLADGLTLSALFVVFAFGLGDSQLSTNLLYVAYLFAAVGAGVVLTIAAKQRVFSVAERIHQRIDNRSSAYLLNRVQVFINGLTPLCTPAKLAPIGCWSLVVWIIELSVYLAITRAFDEQLSVPICVLFLVAVNFSSLIPAAPGGIGVIEAVASAVLVSIGVPREKALVMVMLQHVIQYLTVGVPGAVILVSDRETLRQVKASPNVE